MKKLLALTENTMVPFSMLALVITATMWLTTLSNRVEANSGRIDRIQQVTEHIAKMQGDIQTIKELMDHYMKERH